MSTVRSERKSPRINGTLASAIATVLSGVAAMTSAPTHAHTDSLGFIITPGSTSSVYNAQIFYGSWHGGNIAAEGSLALYSGGNLIGTQAFSMVPSYTNVSNGTIPTGLTAGVNYFFADTSTPTTGDLTGNPVGHSIFNFQSVTFIDLTPGLYNFGYSTVSGLSVNWAPSDPAINAGSFTITANGQLGGVGGAAPSSNDIDTAQGSYSASNLGGTLNPVFTGGTLLLNQNLQSYSQTFSLDDSGTSSIDLAGNTNLFSGVFQNASGVAGSITFIDSSNGGLVTLTGVNTHTGVTTIASGTVLLSGSGTLGATAGTTTVAGGTLDLGGTTQTQNMLVQTGGSIEGGALTVDTYRITGGILAADTTVAAATLFDVRSGAVQGVLTGDGALQKSGAGTVTLAATNTYSGGTEVTSGTLVGTATSFGTGAIRNDATLVIDQTGDATLANEVSGTGALMKTGAGVLTLAAVNTHQGGTTVNAGTLQGTTAGFGSGTITNNATVVLLGDADATFANALDGNGSFVKVGSGSLNLTGTGSFSGTMQITAGRVAVNGALAHSTMTVASNATLGGNGAVGGVVVEQGGMVAPGNSIGTLHVAGNYTAVSGSMYEVELDATGASDRIVATGTASIADGAILDVVKLDGATPYTLGTRYTVITAEGGLTGEYTLTGDTAVSAFFGLIDGYDATSAWLEVAQTTTFASLAQTPNQSAAASGLNSLALTHPVFSAVAYMQSGSEARAAYDLLSGEIHASLQTGLLMEGLPVRSAAMDRARGAHDTSGSADGVALTQNPECVDDPQTTDCPVVWMQALGSRASLEGSAGIAEFDSSTTGLLTGTDIRIGDWRLGVLGGYTQSSSDVQARWSSATNSAYQLGVYGSSQWGALGLRAGVTYAWHDVETQRSVSATGYSDRLEADYDADTRQVFGEVGYRLKMSDIAIEPYAGLTYGELHTDGFAEHGGAAALTGSAQSIDMAASTLGVRLATQLNLGTLPVTTRLMAGWQHAYSGLTPVTMLAFEGGDAFTVMGTSAARDAALVEAGMEFNVMARGSLSFSYAGQMANNAQDHGIKANLNLAF